MTTLADAIATPASVNINGTVGRQAATVGKSVSLCNEDYAALTSTAPVPVKAGPFVIKPVAASATDFVLGATGAVGDYLNHIVIQPGTTSPGTVVIKDGSTVVYTFPGGASSVTNLVPFHFAAESNCVGAAWKITTGANVTVSAVGTFT